MILQRLSDETTTIGTGIVIVGSSRITTVVMLMAVTKKGEPGPNPGREKEISMSPGRTEE